jgi:hypothetical protein
MLGYYELRKQESSFQEEILKNIRSKGTNQIAKVTGFK